MADPAIVTLPCGCFFQGRELITAEECPEHGGGDEMATCDSCGGVFHLNELDGKPTINSKLRRTRAKEGQLMMLYRAAMRGYDFDRLECRGCYGPGYCTAT